MGTTTAPSDKKGKQAANRLLRRISRIILRKGYAEDIPQLREISNVWDFPKDGKQYVLEPTPKDLRK